ncbi:Cdc6/Cdc18 family protein [Halobaculum sp. EA56]|uniref:Cdc6/Cdc18 family protein n=1 Tax=Halobaculum sp. EA56 TaxID=3421648 RepID=UPI003EB8CEDD
MSVPRVLELDSVPERMPHRDATLRQLASALDPIRSDRPAYPICLSGPTGAGKTAVSQFAVRELRRETAVKTAHVDCLRTRSRAAILEEALVDAGLKSRSSPKANAASELLAQLEDADSPVVLTLDEAEHIEDEHLAHVLFETSGVTPIFVMHEYERFAARLDSATASRLRTGPHIELDRYAQHEIVDILESRIEAGDLSGITDGTLEVIADTAAGNAREAISILREAYVEGRSRDERVTPALVADVREPAQESIRRYNIERLDTPHRLLKHMIDDAGEIRADELAELFEVEYPDAEPRERRRYLNVLVRYGCIRKKGSGRGTRYLSIGETKK